MDGRRMDKVDGLGKMDGRMNEWIDGWIR